MPLATVVATIALIVASLEATVVAAQEPARTDPQSNSAVVTGIVRDQTAGIPSAQINLRVATDSTLVRTAVTDSQGRFRIEGAPEGTFFVRIQRLGYRTVSTTVFAVAAKEVRDLGDLRLPVDALELDPVTVSIERDVVTHGADRDVYNLGVMGSSEGESVTETLSRIPDLQVDIGGRVTLLNQPVAIYIDDRRAPLSGEALALFLERLPSNLLLEIEVIHNPSARYDVEGTGGVLNLVTREGVELGVSGSLFSRADTRGQYTVGGQSTIQRGSWTVSSQGSLDLSDQVSSDYELTQRLNVEPPYRRRDGRSDRSGLSGVGNLKVAYDPKETFGLYLEVQTWRSGRDQEAETITTHLADLETPILSYHSSRSDDSRRLSFDLAAGVERSWKASAQEVRAEVRSTRTEDLRESRLEVIDSPGAYPEGLAPTDLALEDEGELETALALQVDYARSWGEAAEVELGYLGERQVASRDRLTRLVENAGAYAEISEGGHEAQEYTHAMYGTAERSLGPATLEIGFRLEMMGLNVALHGGQTLQKRHLSFFPSANFAYRIDRDRRIRLSYSRRVNRPGVSVLNPVDTSTDPLERRVGNPDIEPQFTHQVNASATWSLPSGSIRFSPHLSLTQNGWSRLISVDEDGIMTRSYGNLAARKSTGASLNYRMHRWRGWGGDFSVSAHRQSWNLDGAEEESSGTASGFSGRINLDGQVTDALSVQGSVTYQSGRDVPQGRTGARFRADFGARYRIPGRGVSVRLFVRDPFALERSTSRLREANYILIGQSEEPSRSVQISVSYTFLAGG